MIPLTVDTETPPYDLLLVLSEETKRKQAEAALEDAERKNRELIKCAPSAICEIEFPTQRFTLVNDAMCVMSGYGRDELLAMSLLDMLVEDDRPRFQTRMESWLRGEEPTRSAEFTIGGKDGRPIHAILDVTLTADQNGNPVGAAVIAHDITQRKEAERALRESEERYRVLAIENERLYRQQLGIAEGLQLALLNIPGKMGRIHVGHLYRSSTKAAKVGGDFYDFFEVRDGKMAALIGDVAGHGIEAARVASLTKDVIHAFAHQTLRPQEAFKRTNRLLLEKSLRGFVTAFLGVLDPESATLRYASAGHPRTLLRRKEGGIELLGEGSPPLGVFAESSWKMGETQLEVGDILLLYTDGITEVRRNGEFFGEERLINLLKLKHLSAERLPKLILDKVLEFSGGVLQDDVAILALSPGEGRV